MAKTENDKTRIKYFMTSVDALDLYLKYFQATVNFNFQQSKKYFDDLNSLWQSAYDTNSDMVSNEAPSYLRRYIVQFVEGAVKYSLGEYKMLQKLPDALPTIFDPNQVGVRLNYHQKGIVDASFLKTKTYSSTWDAQGLSSMRSGAVWYRHELGSFKESKGKPISLFLGGFEDEARVYINGEYIGTSGRRFSNPAAYDLSDAINYDGANTLVIQIIRNSAANEIGLGGLIRPSFIFTGPRLETKAPQPAPSRRILPGGELGEVEE